MTREQMIDAAVRNTHFLTATQMHENTGCDWTVSFRRLGLEEAEFMLGNSPWGAMDIRAEFARLAKTAE